MCNKKLNAFYILLKMYVRNVNNFTYRDGITINVRNYPHIYHKLDDLIGFQVSVVYDKISYVNASLYMDLSFKNKYTPKCFRSFSIYPNGPIYDAKIEFDKNYILKDIVGISSHQISLYAIPRTITFAYKNTELFSQNIRKNGALILFAFKELCSDITPIIVEFLANEVIADLSLYKCVNP